MLPQLYYRQKDLFIKAARKVLAEQQTEWYSEAAFPAYTNTNSLIRYLFWQRVERVMAFLIKQKNVNSILDFGCGGGAMLPFLGQISKNVVAFDTDLRPIEKIQSQMAFPSNVSICDGQKVGISELAPRTFDFILALDVLEHVEDLERTLSDLLKLLRPNGEMLVSGPTENFAYQIGRMLAGPEYSGHYHHRSIYDIKKVLETMANVTTLSTLYYPLPLFKIYRARPKA